MMRQPDPVVRMTPAASHRPLVVQAASVLLMVLVMAGCSRFGFIRPDPSRRGFESTAHEVVITNNGRSGARGALALVQLAQQRLGKGDFVAAEREAKRALKMDPRSAAAYAVLAITEDRKGNAIGAGQHYSRAAELEPTQGGMLNNYGTWLCSHGRAAESLAWFDRALGTPGYQTPDVAAANAGACALQAGQTVRAERSLRQAVALDPENQVALLAMAELEFKAGSARAARAFSERRLAAAPADPATLLLASQIEYKLGDRKAAEEYLRRLRTEFPNAQSSETGDGGRR